MTTLTGILEWPQRAEGRIRQLRDSTLTKRDDDPFVPVAMGDQFPLRNWLELTVRVEHRKPRRRRRGGRAGPGSGGPKQTRPVVEQILKIEGMDPDAFRDRLPFEELTSLDPEPRLELASPG